METAMQTDLNVQPEGSVMADPSEIERAALMGDAPATVRRDHRGGFIYGDPDHTGQDEAVVEFYRNPVTDLDYIKKDFIGDKFFKVDRPVTEEDKLAYARKWALYQQAEDQMKGQTRLRNVSWLDEAMKARLAEKGVMTLEQLAGLTDTHLDHLGPGVRKVRSKAHGFLSQQKQFDQKSEMVGKIEALTEQNESVLAENAKLQEQVKALMARVEGQASVPKAKGSAKDDGKA